MPDYIKFRRDSAANWRTYNSLLAAGEPGFETDTGLLKIGDGSTTWQTLQYVNRPDVTVAGGRLSIYPDVPISPPNPGYFHATPPTILYYVPCTSNLIALWTGSSWRIKPFSGTAISLVGLPANTNYDVFARIAGGGANGPVELVLVAWADDWTRTALAGCNGVGITRYQGVMVQCGNTANRYLGTIRTSAAGGSTQDNFWRRFVYNYNNQVLSTTFWYHGIAHTYASSYWRQWDNGSFGDSVQSAQSVNKIQIVAGVPTPIFVKLNSYIRYGNVATIMYGAATQRHPNAAIWNGVTPFGDFTAYGFDQVNIVNPAPLGGSSVFTLNSSGTIGRNGVGLVEFWVAEYGYNSDSWFLNTSLSADLLM